MSPPAPTGLVTLAPAARTTFGASRVRHLRRACLVTFAPAARRYRWRVTFAPAVRGI